MRIRLVGVVLLAAAPLALAEPTLNGQTLAMTQATFDFCARIKPEAAAQFQMQAGVMRRGMTEDELQALRDTAEYKDAYDTTTSALAQVSRREAMEACSGNLIADGRKD